MTIMTRLLLLKFSEKINPKTDFQFALNKQVSVIDSITKVMSTKAVLKIKNRADENTRVENKLSSTTLWCTH